MESSNTMAISSKRKLSTVDNILDVIDDSSNGHPSSYEQSVNSAFSVVVIGGGIAGLGAALALQNKGFRVSVYERDALFEDRRQGYGLTLTNNPKGPLAELDLLDECIARDCPSNAHWIFAPEGNVLGYYGRSFKSKGEASTDTIAPLAEQNSRDKCGGCLPQDLSVEGRGNLRIPRQNLRKMMLDRLKPGTVRWGMKLLDYTEDSHGVNAQFQNIEALDVKAGNTKDNSSPSTSEEEAITRIISEDRRPPSNSIETVSADILVGADGIRSIVRQLRSQKVGVLGNNKLIQESSPLHYVGVAVILGITTATHPLINQQGFYCLDGTNRLFTMPFEDGDSAPYIPKERGEGQVQEQASNTDASGALSAHTSVSESKYAESSFEAVSGSETAAKKTEGKTKLTMWQLSFSDFTEEEGMRLRTAGPDELLGEALRRCEGWFEPVCAMIHGTPKKEVWGTGLYDRDPMPLRGKDQGSRVTVIGDACHPMSMFKGQGANQALHDGPLLASWLDSGAGSAVKKQKQKQHRVNPAYPMVKVLDCDLNAHNVYTRLRCFEREMVARTSSKVQASREAASKLHSPSVLSEDFGVEGVKAHMSSALLSKLHDLKIGAHLSSELEVRLRHVINELQPDIR